MYEECNCKKYLGIWYKYELTLFSNQEFLFVYAKHKSAIYEDKIKILLFSNKFYRVLF